MSCRRIDLTSRQERVLVIARFNMWTFFVAARYGSSCNQKTLAPAPPPRLAMQNDEYYDIDSILADSIVKLFKTFIRHITSY